MKTFKLTFFALVAGLLILSSCDMEGDRLCVYDEAAKITDVAGPETATVGETVNFTVAFKVENDCGMPQGFSFTNTFPKKINVIVRYDGCECDDTPETEIRQYPFEADEPGEYELRFTSGDQTSITKIITVTE